MIIWTQVENIPKMTQNSCYEPPVLGLLKYKLVLYSLTHALELMGTLLWPFDFQPSPRHCRILVDM